MIILRRIATGITSHMPSRASEWTLAAILLNWGLNVAMTPGYLDREYWTTLRDLLPSEPFSPVVFWGGGAIVVAALRLLALVINGTFATTAWSRYSPHVRMLMATFSCFFWMTQVLSVWTAEQFWTGLSASAFLLLLDFYNIARTSTDARHSDEAHRNGIAGT
ncbi:hypothetical protein [Kaistia sp. MMO-174]|uniref:hypothetical protein n=1 Tax=Kaistia sp. MMO-174 TaxID=3081256 RepID=UPI00301A3527